MSGVPQLTQTTVTMGVMAPPPLQTPKTNCIAPPFPCAPSTRAAPTWRGTSWIVVRGGMTRRVIDSGKMSGICKGRMVVTAGLLLALLASGAPVDGQNEERYQDPEPHQQQGVGRQDVLLPGGVGIRPAGKSAPLPANRHYQVSLDDAPEERWAAIVPYFVEPLQEVKAFIEEQMPTHLAPIVEAVASDLEGHFGEPYASEIRGVSKYANLSLGVTTLANLFYELNSGCTSIVASDASGGITHGRNLDYIVPGLTDMTVIVDYTRGGKTAYRGVSYVGLVGITTGLRPGSYSVSLNERDSSKSDVWAKVKTALETLVRGGQPVTTTIRSMLEHDATLGAALFTAQHTHLMSDAYLILGGTEAYQGAVVTRSRDRTEDVWMMDKDAGEWFLCETNYDHWQPTPSDDDRRAPAVSRLKAFGSDGQTFTADDMWSVIMAFPNSNADTTFSAVMSARTGNVTVMLQNIASA